MKSPIILFTSLFLITGCTVKSDHLTSNEKNNSEVRSVEVTNDKYVNNPQAPDTRLLTETGQKFKDEDGTVALRLMSNHEGTHEIGPIKLSINKVKVLNYSPSADLIDFFHGLSDDETNFNYVKLSVVIENTSNQTIEFAPVSTLKTSVGEIKSYEDDFYLQNLYGKLIPNQQKSGELAFVLNNTNISSLSSIVIQTSDVFGENNNPLYEGEAITIDFKTDLVSSLWW